MAQELRMLPLVGPVGKANAQALADNPFRHPVVLPVGKVGRIHQLYCPTEGTVRTEHTLLLVLKGHSFSKIYRFVITWFTSHSARIRSMIRLNPN